jgi:hypothetical protein
MSGVRCDCSKSVRKTRKKMGRKVKRREACESLERGIPHFHMWVMWKLK